VRRVAAIYDIHGNLPALEAVLDQIRPLQVDCILIGGDVLPGPMPRETLDCLRNLEIPARFVLGNGEVAVLEQMRGNDPVKVPEAFRPVIRWTAQQLDSECERFIAGWPKTTRAAISGIGEVLFCHATPQNENDCFTRLTSEACLLPVFAGLDVSLVVCGHTHMQFDRRIGDTRVVNAGSVGMPFGDPGADWLFLGPDVELRHATYNFESAAARIRATSYPQAGDFAHNNVLHPPSASDMLDLFTRVGLR
jgi:Icc-related predicted phosphoesterase